MNKQSIKDKIKQKMTVEESAVGFPGRTAKHEADNFVAENQDLIQDFKEIVKQIGGKAVACQLLERMKMGKQFGELEEFSEEAMMKPEDAQRFDKHVRMEQEEFDDFIDLGLVDAYPRKQGGQTRVDIYAKGKPIVRGYYYPELNNLIGEEALIKMALRSMTI